MIFGEAANVLKVYHWSCVVTLKQKIRSMKTLMKLVATALLSVGLIGSVFATTWSHSLGGTGYYYEFVSVPSAAQVTQQAAAYGWTVPYVTASYAINYGPLGSYQRNGGYTSDPALNITGNIAGGSYQIILQVDGSGYSITQITW